MVKEASRLYVAVDDQGVAVVDISSPDNPSELNFFPAGGRVFGLAVRGDTLYAALGSEGLRVYDCSNVYAPELLGALPDYNLRSLNLEGSLLYATDPEYGLRIMDISDPSMPKVVSSANLPGQHYGLALDTSLGEAWLCSFYGGVHILDVSDAYNPTLKATVPMAGAWSVDLTSALALVAAWDDSVHVIDRQNYEQLASVGFEGFQVWPYDIVAQDNRFALVGFLGSWWVFDASVQSNPVISDGYARGGITDEVIVHEGWVITGMQGSKLVFFQATHTLAPVVVVTTQDWPRDFYKKADTLFVAEGWAGLGLYDISDPESGVDLISRFSVEGIHVWEVLLNSGYVFLACGDSGLLGVDFSDPLNPQRMWRLDFATEILTLLLSDTVLYVGSQDRGIFLVDVSIPDDPNVISSHSGSVPVADMLLDDNILYVALSLEGVSVYDVESLSWILKAKIPSGHAALSLALQKDILFIADGSAGIKAYDVSVPSSPHLVGSLDTGGEARDMDISSDILLIADGYDGLMRARFLNLDIEETPAPSSPAIQVWPNPFTSRLYFDPYVEADLYDASGRLVVRIRGRSYDTSRLKSGVYFLKGLDWQKTLVKISIP